jgi:hypothetical protein
MKPPLTPPLSPRRGEGVFAAIGFSLHRLWLNAWNIVSLLIRALSRKYLPDNIAVAQVFNLWWTAEGGCPTAAGQAL